MPGETKVNYVSGASAIAFAASQASATKNSQPIPSQSSITSQVTTPRIRMHTRLNTNKEKGKAKQL